MNYEQFKETFLRVLRDSNLPTIGPPPSEETLDLRFMERSLKVHVLPVGELGGPFHVAGTISWRWDALQAARTVSTERDFLTTLFGRDEAGDLEAEQPWLRVEVELRAGVDSGKAIPMPSPAKWSRWSREALSRLENIERVAAKTSYASYRTDNTPSSRGRGILRSTSSAPRS